MTTEKFITTCDVCGKRFQFGPHRHEGRRNKTYDIMVCNTCHDSNWDGWAPGYEKLVTKNLEAINLPLPQRNDKQLLPRE